MSEYMDSKPKPPTFDDLDHTGTLFDPTLENDEYDQQLDRIVDTQNLSYSDARSRLGAPPAETFNQDKLAAPYWTMEEYYEKWLAMMKVVGGVGMRAGFGVAAHYKEEITDRYESQLPAVMKAAQKNMDEGVHEYRRIFGEADLIGAGFDPQEVRDESNAMLSEMRRTFFGPENANARAKARRHVEKRIRELRRSPVNS